MPGHVPLRTCIACGAEKPQGELLRFVLGPEGQPVADLKGKLPGRGCYTCLSADCVRAALTRKRFSRGFRTEVCGGDPEAAVAQIAAQFLERLGGYLSLAAKAGKALSGSDVVAEALKKKGKVGLLVLAGDISPDSAARFLHPARQQGMTVVTVFDKETLGRCLGKELRSVVAVEPGGFAASIRNEWQKYRNFVDGGVRQDD